MALVASESQIQKAYFSWVRMKALQDPRYEMIIKVPNETRGNFCWLRKMLAEGLAKGFPDILCLHPVEPFHGMALEFKKKGGKVSKEQERWLRKLSEAGWLAQVVYNVEMAISITESYFDFCKESRCKLVK